MKYLDVWFMQQSASHHVGSVSMTSTIYIVGNLRKITHTWISTLKKKN